MASTGWPASSDTMAAPLATSHSRIMPSSAPLTGMPVGSRQQLVTAPSWPRRVRLWPGEG
jgi:hypothetical protein